MSDADELDRITHRIEAFCEAAYEPSTAARRPGPYYVSALGIDLGPDLQKLKAITKSSLTDFIASRLAGKYELARMGAHGNILAVIPVGSEVPEPREAEPAQASQKRDKYHYRLWAAFSVPASGEGRWINLNDLTFVDLSRDDEHPADALEIPLEMVPPEDMPRRDDAIWDSVTRWLEDNKLPRERFLASARKPARTISMTSTAASSATSLLESVLHALDRRQLQITHLPLDIVATLLHTRSR